MDDAETRIKRKGYKDGRCRDQDKRDRFKGWRTLKPGYTVTGRIKGYETRI